MTEREQAIFLAKRLIVDSIWKSASLEGLGTTFPKTEMILENIEVGTTKEEVLFIVNMKRAWDFLLVNLDYKNSLAMLGELNKIVGDGLYYGNGEVRKLPVAIGGTDWCPSTPDESLLYDTINSIECISNPVDKALKYFCFIARSQIFIDGNKRVAQLMANKVLIDSGVGVFQIPINGIEQFKTLLINYYETGNDSKIISFMKDYCIRDLSCRVENSLTTREDVRVFKNTGTSDRFVLSPSQCRVMGSVLYNLVKLLKSYGLEGKFNLFEEGGDFYLCGNGFKFRYNYTNDIYSYSYDGGTLNIDFNILKEFLIKTIELLNDKIPFSVKSIRFSIDSSEFVYGIIRDSDMEKGSIEIVVE